MATLNPPDSKRPIALGLTPASDSKDLPPRLSRSPHPYSHRKESPDLASDTTNPEQLPSPAPTPSPSDSEFERIRDRRQSKGTPGGQISPTESGTEADDEALTHLLALPAPPFKPRKGLRGSQEQEPRDTSPAHTPQLEQEEWGPTNSETAANVVGFAPDDGTERKETSTSKKRPSSRRASEVRRRTCEVLFVLALCLTVLRDGDVRAVFLKCRTETLIAACVLPALCGLYVVRLLLHSQTTGGSQNLDGLSIPRTFDPAPLLYPFLVPTLVALSLSVRNPGIVIPNLILSLSSLPPPLVPLYQTDQIHNCMHWLLSMAPIILAQPLAASRSHRTFLENSLGSRPESRDPEVLVFLYPLHQTLLPCLRFLTTTSLLPSEVQLLSASLINLLLLASSPQAKILNYILWIGGVGIFLLCSGPLRWNVALERIPSLRFRRAGRIISAGNSFLSALSEGLNASQVSEEVVYEEPNCFPYNSAFRRSHFSSKSFKENSDNHHERATSMSIHANHVGQQDPGETTGPVPCVRKRSLTAPSVPNVPRLAPQNSRPGRRKTLLSRDRSDLMTLTHKQATTRKLIYTIYTYSIIAFLVLGPIRMTIATQALQGYDPFCWAIGYLFGQMPVFRLLVQEYGLESAIPLPQMGAWGTSSGVDWTLGGPGWLSHFLSDVVGSTNTRLLLLGYFAFILTLGILTVLGLSSTVEVDTRRKVFHGTMVAMLMPTAFIDPSFLSLGLGVVLALFLLLELVRAAQLRPLSKPLARFLTPYVDGRDLRGPVVVSHIFLLIGCAIPFWLSLADADLEEASSGVRTQPWLNWDILLAHRNVDMLAGVVCVGLGDAAASLIGRRFGRRKWPWAGGKSLEGSAAFAVAVTFGLVVAKAWLWAGGWFVFPPSDDGAWEVVACFAVWLGTCVLAGAMSSFCEAVLTGCNDNVVVPVVLWLVVRGLKI